MTCCLIKQVNKLGLIFIAKFVIIIIIIIITECIKTKKDRECNVTLRRVRATTVAAEKQYV